MKIKRLALIVLSVLLATSLTAWAEAKPNIVLKLKVEKEVTVTDNEGHTKLEWREVGDTNPADILKYTLMFTNTGPVEAKGVVINDPVPAGTAYVGNSAQGSDTEITYSIDGKAFQPPPMLTYKIKKSDGTEEDYQVTPDMYTHIRWKLTEPVAPGAGGALSFMVRVN